VYNYKVYEGAVANLSQVLHKCHKCYIVTIRWPLHRLLVVIALTISKTTVSYATISYATIRVLTNFHCAMQHTRQYPLCSATYQSVCVVQCNILGSIHCAVQHTLWGRAGGQGGCLLYVQYTKTFSNNFSGHAKSSRKLLYVQGLFLGYEPTR
jgi:hypothetical protein